MSNLPDTRTSLILRLADSDDVDAWAEFVRLYEPSIYRLALSKGLQHADAQDVVQEILTSVSRNVSNWVPDPERGPFRAWLFRIARSRIVNSLTRSKPHNLGTGGTTATRLLGEHSDGLDNDWQLFEQEYRRTLFQKAADRVQVMFTEQSWQCFWLTTVDGVSIAEVATRFDISAGSVYIARSRVMARIREEVRVIEEETE